MFDSRKLKNDLIYIAIKGVIYILEKLPRHWTLRLAGVLGEIAAVLDVKERKLAERNLKLAYGDKWNDLEIELVAKDCFVKVALNAADVIQSRKWSADDLGKLVKVEGWEHFQAAFEQDRGVIGLTGHIGNFELLAAWFASVKKIPLSAIGRALYDKRLDKMVIENRKRFGIENIVSDAAAKNVITILRSGRMLGVLLDVDSSKFSGRFAPFFGVPAKTAAGPMLIGRRTQSPVVPMAMFRTDDNRYLVKILPAFDIPSTDDKDTDIDEALARCNVALEELINHDPTQWAWMHNRWKSKSSENEQKSVAREALSVE
ncbi:MAG: lysophospholipid acyltransferase family protein [candidate division Zixibacteria bacterium]